MSTGSASATVVITATIRPDKVAMARRELEAVIATVMATEPGSAVSACTMIPKIPGVATPA